LARGIYTDELDDAPERVVHRYWPEITGRLFRSAVVTDRSARRGGPSEDGYLFVESGRANLEEAKAFLDAREAERTGLRLELPGRRAAGPPETS